MTDNEQIYRRDKRYDRELRVLKDRIKADIRMDKDFVRKARTARIRERGILLESFLQEPEFLSDEQVQALLALLFAQPVVQAILKQHGQQ